MKVAREGGQQSKADDLKDALKSKKSGVCLRVCVRVRHHSDGAFAKAAVNSAPPTLREH